MKIFAKKAFEFKNSDGERVTTKPLEFATLPEWAAKDNMFKWAVSDGDIEIIKTAKQAKEIEKDPKGTTPPAQ